MDSKSLSDILINEPTGQAGFPGNGLASLLDEPEQPKAQEPAKQVGDSGVSGGATGSTSTSTSMPPSASVADFVKNAMPAAERVAKRLNVPVEAVLGQWGLETGWGKSVIPGTNNLGNIKDFRGGGVSAKDNQNGSVDKYRKYGSVDDFAEDFANLVSGGIYKAVPGAKDAQSYFSTLKAAGYAEDAQYVAKGTAAARMVAEAMKTAGTGKPDFSKAPKWADITGKAEFKALSDDEKAQAKGTYFDYWIAPQVGDDATAKREEFMALSDTPGIGKRLADGLSELGQGAVDAVKGMFTSEPNALERPNADVPKNAAASLAPVRPEVRAKFTAAWDAATPEQRNAMAGATGWMGMLARERAGLYDQPSTQQTETGQQFDPRAEGRQAAMIAKGEDARAAKTYAQMGAKQGITPGQEIKQIGSIESSGFDFETQDAFGAGPSNGLNNVLTRGVTKGAVGFGKAITGYGEFLSDVYGLDETGATMRAGSKWARGKEEAIGEKGTFLERNLEGAISSVAQQLPLLMAGVGLASEAVPLAGIAMQSFGQEYSDGKAQGLDTEQAGTRAAAFAAFEVIGERFGLGAQMNAIRGATHGMATQEIIKFMASALKKELPGELLTTTGQFAIDKWAPAGMALKPNATMEDYLSQVADTIAQTIMQGGIMTGGTTGVSTAVRHMQDNGPSAGVLQGDANNAQDRAMTAWENNGLSAGHPGQVQAPAGIAPVAPVAPTSTAHPMVQEADQIVRELAEQAGIPLETVLPQAPAQVTQAVQEAPTAPVMPLATQADREQPAQDEATAPPQRQATQEGQFSNDDVMAFAHSRYRTLTAKSEGGLSLVPGDEGMVERETPGVALNDAEQREMDALIKAGTNPDALRSMYGFDDHRTEVAEPTKPLEVDGDIPGFGSTQGNGIAPNWDDLETAPTEPAQAADTGSGESEQFTSYAKWIKDGKEVPAGMREQIRGDIRLNDGESDSLLAMADEAAPVAPAKPVAKPMTEKQARAGKEYSDKWFGSADKAKAFIAKQGISASHEVDQDGQKFIIKKKGSSNGTQTPQAQQAGAQLEEAGNQGSTAQTGAATPRGGIPTTGRADVQTDGVSESAKEGSAQARWMRMRQADREALIIKTIGLKPAGATWHAALPWADVHLKIRKVLEAEAAGTAQEPSSAEAPDAWRGHLVKTRAYAKTLIDAGRLNGDAARAVWGSENEIAALIDATPDSVAPAAADDFDAMFDEVLAEEMAKDEAKATPAQKPKTEKAAKAAKQAATPREMGEDGRAKDGKPITGGDVFKTLSGRTTTGYPGQKSERYASAWLIENATAEAKSRGDDFNARTFGATTALKGGGLTTSDRESMLMYLFGQQPDVVPSILKPLASAAGNTGAALANAIDGLGALFGGGGKLSSGFTFDEDTYAKAKPLFTAAVANLGDAGKDLREAMRAVVRMVLGKFGTQAAQNMKPYVVRFIEENSTDRTKVEEGRAPSKIEGISLHTPEGKFAAATVLADHLIGGGVFDTIISARKMISEIIGHRIEAATELAKQADETVEVAVVLAAREMVAAGRKQGRTSQVIYDRLLSLLKAQPNLAVRSSTSMRDQAYSTPVPLAYLASELAGVTFDSKLIESTAGNGMLAIGATLANATVNELNPKRAAMLKAIGFNPTTSNAATTTLTPARSMDAVVINPPFGVTKDASGNTIVYEVKPNYGTREVDHAIVFKTLEAMKDDGRAVLIVGGVLSEEGEARREDYRGKNKRTFYFNLYNDYNVVDHFTVDGALYAKQGASYPVDVIVIDGRGKSSRDLPAAALPNIIRSYEDLKEKLNVTSSMGTRGDAVTNDADGGAGGAGNADDKSGMVSGTGPTRGQPGATGERPAGVDDAGVQVSGATGGNGQPNPGGAVSGNGQLDAQGNDAISGNQRRPIRAGGGGEGAGKRSSTARDSGKRPDAVGGPSKVSGEHVQSGLTDRRGQEQETENQVAYTPHSKASAVGTLVPRAMKDAIQASLQRITDEVGSIDQYVADSLAIDTKTLSKNFSAEQIDALAMAIKNAVAGNGFIIGDQTGVGKGRVVAGMVKYALINGKVPIFVTEKPNLYGDMIRDLDDIGMTEELGLDTDKSRLFITNNNETIPYSLVRTNGEEVTEHKFNLRPAKSGAGLDPVMMGMISNNELGDYKVIFTTYSQLQTVMGKTTGRQRFVQHFGAGNYMIFDESHNAGGTGGNQARTKEQRTAAKEGKSLVTGRAAFVRSLVENAYGTFFSSATYAKRPDVMDLYSSTNMRLAVDKIADLGEAIQSGGVPMQQTVAYMLTQDGQYIRRERTFAGVSYDTVQCTVDKTTAENMASAMREILAFSRRKDAVISQMQKDADKEGSIVQGVNGKVSIEGVNFGSTMHNLIDQMLLALKVESSVKHAIERLKAGEKVVLTVSNTMGSFLGAYADEMGLKSGDVVGLSFGDLYLRYLEKQRVIKIKSPTGDQTSRRLTDAELGSELTEMFNKTQTQIREAGFGNAPISPIDYMHAELRKAGYKTDEITGRTMVLNYVGDVPTLGSRVSDIRQRVNAVRGFNAPDVDVLILNQSGATGLSLHAASKVKDKRKRHMIIVQAEKNIDTHMQMLGRVHRTGQVVTPSYSQMMADIPAEMRPAAVLLKKMASLNANTTASRKSSVTAEGVVDFMNDYGGQVVHEYLYDNPDMHSALGGNKVLKLTDKVEDAGEEDIRRLTGYIPILPLADQERIYSDITLRYNELIERENSLGTNKLEAKALDLDAETITVKPLTEQKEGSSVFAAPANMELVNVKRTVKPFSSAEVAATIADRLNGKPARSVAAETIQSLNVRGNAFIDATMAKAEAAEKADPVRLSDQRQLLSMTLRRIATILETYKIGDHVSVGDATTGISYGVITEITSGGRTSNPAAGSDWKMTVALANGDAKSITINFSQIGNRYQIQGEGMVEWYNAENQQFERMRITDIFDKGASVRREKRWMVTGNILAGYAKFKGQIVSYTKNDGTVAQGVLMSRQFDFEKEMKDVKVGMRTVSDAMTFFDRAGLNSIIGTEDGNFKIMLSRDQYMALTPSAKRQGGSYYLDEDLTTQIGADFYKRGAFMSANIPQHRIKDVLDYLINERKENLVALTHHDLARVLVEQGKQNAKQEGPTVMAPANTPAPIPEADWLSESTVAQVIEERIGQFRHQPPILLRDSVIDVPHMREAGAGAAAGATSRGSIYIFRDANATVADIVSTLWHELVHYGLRRFMNKEQYIGQMQKLYDRDPWVKASADAWLATDGMDVQEARKHGEAYARSRGVDEALAQLGEINQGEYRTNTLKAKAIRTVARWLAAMAERFGFHEFAAKYRAVTNDEARDLVRSIFEKLKDDATATSSDWAFTADPSFMLRKVQNNLIQFFGSQTPGKLDTFNAYDKTIGSQYNKALKDKHFGKVYQLLLGMQNHVSMAAMRAARLAPGVMPAVDDIKGAAKALFSRRKQGAMDKAAHAVFSGTLAGENVLQGTVWTEEDLRNRFLLDDTGVALYRQTREAIDASLDEVAAAESFNLAHQFMNRDMRAQVISNPETSEGLILDQLDKQLTMARMAIAQAELAGDEQQANEMAAMRDSLKSTIRMVETIFTTAKNLKLAGYAPLMRFGNYTVEAKHIDPVTGNVERDANGQQMTAFFQRYETDKEARKAEASIRDMYAGRDDVEITAGTYNNTRHELYTGVTPETLELFAEATGMGGMADEFIRLVKSDRSAMKRQLERKGTPGFSKDLPRVLSMFITSNARHAAQRFYMSSINQAVKRIPKEKGDVQQEAQKLRNFVLNPDDAGSISSSLMFAWFLGGSVASAAVNMTQPLMVTLPYLTQFTTLAKASALLTKAMPAAFGKAEITDKALREGLERASLEGVVDAQEIFHLYSMGSHQLIKGNKGQAALTLWGSLFSGVEKINRRMTFIAAWNLAIEQNNLHPYAFAVRAVNQTQGIYNKVNRPNVSRTWQGRLLMTYKGYSLMVGELMVRMWKTGPAGKKAVLIMLAMLFLASGEEGLPMSKAVDDLFDTIGQLLGFDSNARRWKRRTAHEILGHAWGDVFLYGASATMPLDFGGRLGLGQMIPGTEILKPSSGIFNTRAIGDLIGPTAGAGRQIGDAAEASFEGNYLKAFQNAAPKAVRDVMTGLEMATSGQATDFRGRKVEDVSMTDAIVKAAGFQPTKVAKAHRRTMPIQQDMALQAKREASIVAKWARAAMEGDQEGVQAAIAERDSWNSKNPDTKIVISKQQILGRVKTMRSEKDNRTFKTAPKEMRGRIGLDLLDE